MTKRSPSDDDSGHEDMHVKAETTESPSKKAKPTRWTQEEKAALVEAFIEMNMEDMQGKHDKWERLAKATGKSVKQCQDQFNAKRPGVRSDIRNFMAGKGK